MKLVALITKTGTNNKVEIALKFYKKSIDMGCMFALKGPYHSIIGEGDIQIKKILPFDEWDYLYKSTYLPSNDSFFLETPYSIQINRVVEPLIDDALKLMTPQQRYEFFEELFKSINKGERPFDINSFSAEELCYIESPWARVDGKFVISPLGSGKN